MPRARRPKPRIAVKPIQARMLAPCGINCAVCIGHLREKNRCPGCTDPREAAKLPHCRRCHFLTCPEPRRSRRFCFDCTRFPCRRLRQLDLRYRTRYRMSPIENLEAIRALGIRRFIAQEKVRWMCSGCTATLSVHRDNCLNCGQPR